MGIFGDLENFVGNVSHTIGSAFDPAHSGFLSGSWENFELGFNRAGSLFPKLISNNMQTVSEGAGKSLANLINPVSYNPLTYSLIGGGLLILIMVAYGMWKIGKYV